jgi:hypothetical protein
MAVSKDEQVAWVKAVQTHLGVSTTELARRAHLAPSTLQRPVNDPAWNGMLSGRTLAAIGEVAGLKPLEFPARMRGMSEADAEPFTYDDRNDAADNLNRAVRELCRGRNGRDAWVMRSYALELAGVLPGDIMIVDLNLSPKPHDIVCAQIYEWSGMKSETVFRIFDPPYLVAHSMRGGIEKPVAVDNASVIIKGVVDSVLRSRN